MASTEQELRREIEQERDRLAEAVDTLRVEIGEAADVGGKMRSKLPLVAAGAFGLGFLRAGGVGATMRLLFRRQREGDAKAAVGRFRAIRQKP
jgi:hypothetical protein